MRLNQPNNSYELDEEVDNDREIDVLDNNIKHAQQI
jgi:hypothetical protein